VYDVIRSQLKERLDQSGIAYTFRDVQEIDEFIDEGIVAVPSIRIDHRKQFTKTDKDTPEDIVNSVVEYVIAHNVQFVICPIDFSEHSIHAAAWAVQFAQVLGMQCKLVHVYKSTATGLTNPQEQTEILKSLNEKIEKVARNLKSDIQLMTLIEVGDPLQKIVHISKEATTGIIIMGTTGMAKFARPLFGSVSALVARHAHSPVLLLPPKINYKKPRQIIVAFNEDVATIGVINKLIDFNRGLQAHLQFLHIQAGSENYPEFLLKLQNRLSKSASTEFSFEVQKIQVDTTPVLDALLAHAKDTEPDLIVFVTRHRNVVKRFLQPGLTTKMQSRLKWPLLVMRNA
jgi:nucleotide-binding universal stress UspA family protein